MMDGSRDQYMDCVTYMCIPQ